MDAALAYDPVVAPADRLVTMPPFPLDGTIRTLGVGGIDWLRANLVQPDGPRAGLAFQPAPDQVDFLLWFYALDDDGRWLFNMGVRRLSKGKGKSPFAAAWSLLEFLGPVRLDRFDDRVIGGCVGKRVPMPLVQVYGVSEDQTRNTMRYVRAFCPKGGHLVETFDLDWGRTAIKFNVGEGELRQETSSDTTAEGGQTTAAVGDEPEHWMPSNRGTELFATVSDNLTKTSGRMLQTCNAWKPGIGSVAEATWEDWCAQEAGHLRGDQRILYDARVAPPGTDMADRDSLMAALEHCYYGSPWMPLEDVIQKIWRKQSKPDESWRKYLNRPTASLDAWVTSEQWALLADPTVQVVDGDEVVLFFDGSKSRDATALVGCRMSDGHVFTEGVWENVNLSPDWTVDTAAVDAAVIRAFSRFRVRAFFADVREWESFAKLEWPKRYGDMVDLWAVPNGHPPEAVAWDMRGHSYEFAKAAELVCEEIVDGAAAVAAGGPPSFTHDGHEATGRHVVNARRRSYRDAVSIAKEKPDSPYKIDAAVCVIGARMVRRLVLSSGSSRQKGGTWW